MDQKRREQFAHELLFAVLVVVPLLGVIIVVTLLLHYNSLAAALLIVDMVLAIISFLVFVIYLTLVYTRILKKRKRPDGSWLIVDWCAIFCVCFIAVELVRYLQRMHLLKLLLVVDVASRGYVPS